MSLPEWFIRLFTKPNDIVMDPFVGSGTSAIVAKKMQRNYIGIDINLDFCLLAEKELRNPKNTLPKPTCVW
jgi:DNA modification methylase